MSDEDKKRMESEGSRATAATTSVSRTRMAVTVFNAMLCESLPVTPDGLCPTMSLVVFRTRARWQYHT
jgi:hypothetical protein